MNKGLGEKILELYEKGFSYREIEAKLGCSKGTVSYHCGSGQKQKTLNNQRRGRKENVLRTKIQRFVATKLKGTLSKEKDARAIEKILQVKITQFSLTGKRKDKSVRCKLMFNVKQLIKKLGSNPVCYLTGRPINLDEGKSYHLDHILPKSKGGDNSLENCGLACRAANQAKTDMTLDEFVQLCAEVIKKHRPNHLTD
ncbi:hypothetical protein EBZ39_09045 [bacterium]|nr:hypothetical protein [bacterium]